MPPRHAESGLRDGAIVHVGEDPDLVVVRTDVQRLDAAPLLERFQPHLAEVGRGILGRHSRNGRSEQRAVIQSGVMIIAVQYHWDLSRADVKAAMSAAHQRASNGRLRPDWRTHSQETMQVGIADPCTPLLAHRPNAYLDADERSFESPQARRRS